MAEQDSNPLESTVYHEAGHAVAHARLGVLQLTATIKPHDDTAGRVIAESYTERYIDANGVDLCDTGKSIADAKNHIFSYCAGYAALKALGQSEQEAILGAWSDFEKVEEIVGVYGLDGSLDEWKARAVALMSTPENIRAVEFVAKALMKHETLDADYVEVLIELADGDITEEEWHQFVSFQYSGMI